MHCFGSTYTESAYPRNIIVYKLFPFFRLHINAGKVVPPSPGIRMSASPNFIAFNHRLCRIVMFSTLTIDLLCFLSTSQLYIKYMLHCLFEGITQYSIQVYLYQQHMYLYLLVRERKELQPLLRSVEEAQQNMEHNSPPLLLPSWNCLLAYRLHQVHRPNSLQYLRNGQRVFLL